MNYPQMVMALLLTLSFAANFHKCISDGNMDRGMKRAYFLYVRTMIIIGLLYWGGYWDCWLK